jgi:hypothetical protein
MMDAHNERVAAEGPDLEDPNLDAEPASDAAAVPRALEATRKVLTIVETLANGYVGTVAIAEERWKALELEERGRIAAEDRLRKVAAAYDAVRTWTLHRTEAVALDTIGKALRGETCTVGTPRKEKPDVESR